MELPEDVLPTMIVSGAFVPTREARVSALDRGFLHGDGIFETLHVVDGVPLDLDRHFDRLATSARFLRLALPFDADGLEALAAELIARNGADAEDEVALRVTLTRGPTLTGPPTLTLHLRRLGESYALRRREGLLAYVLPLTRSAGDLARHKTTAWLASALGQLLLRDRTPDPRAEGIFVTSAGEALEGATTNLFVVEAGRVVTPPRSAGVLPGVVRGLVLELAAELGLDVLEDRLPLARVRAADEAFATSSTLHVVPVMALDDAPIGSGRPGPVTRDLAAAYERLVAAQVVGWYARRGL